MGVAINNKHSLSKWRYQPFQMPFSVFIMLSTLLILFASAPFILPAQKNLDAPILTFLRNEDGEFFAHSNLNRGPILYGWLHAIPGGLWCALMPLQYIKKIRREYPTIHRLSGRFIILLSLILSISSMLFGPKNLMFSASTFYIHKLKIGKQNPKTIFFWPSFRMLVWFLSPSLLFSSIQTIRFARLKRFEKHQYWASVLTLVGYSIPMQRVMMLILSIFASHLSYLSNDQREFFGIPNDKSSNVIEKSQIERAAFSFTAWSAVSVMLIWSIIQSYRRNIELQKVQKSKS